MGTDIHLYVERKLKDKWVLVDPIPPFQCRPDKSPAELLADCAKDFEEVVPDKANLWDIMRYYHLFTRLAGVRRNSQDIRVIAGVKYGTPDDISSMLKARYDLEREDVHSAAFCTLLDLVSRSYEGEPDLVGVHLNMITEALSRVKQAYGLKDDEVRIVYWFDN